MLGSKTFHFSSTQQYGSGAYQGYRAAYRLPGVAVLLRTSGRIHGGSMTFSFTNAEGTDCTAAEWVKEQRAVKPSWDLQLYESAGLKIQLQTYGRAHTGRFDVEVEPGLSEAEDSSMRPTLSWYYANNVFDVLAA